METGVTFEKGSRRHGKVWHVIVSTLGRVIWCLMTSAYFWAIDGLTHPHIESGVIWMIGFAVGLITWQMERA